MATAVHGVDAKGRQEPSPAHVVECALPAVAGQRGPQRIQHAKQHIGPFQLDADAQQRVGRATRHAALEHALDAAADFEHVAQGVEHPRQRFVDGRVQ